jgi:hypothetical protein
MATVDPDDIRKNDDVVEEDTADQVQVGAAGALAAGVPGAVVDVGLPIPIPIATGATAGGQTAARDFEDEGLARPTQADVADSPDTFAGGGATSAGQDDPRS